MPSKPLYAKLKLLLITVPLLVMAWAHGFVANNQLGTRGFAAGFRDPNYFTFILGWLLVFAALASSVLVLKARRFDIGMIVLIILIVALPMLYFLSW